jgi:hypothetical protein
MKEQHLIIPPSDLVQEWWDEARDQFVNSGIIEEYVVRVAAQWGADQELEACVEWLGDAPVVWDNDKEAHPGSYLREARRPKSLKLAEKATRYLDDAVLRGDCITTTEAMPYIRKALQRLEELESEITKQLGILC